MPKLIRRLFDRLVPRIGDAATPVPVNSVAPVIVAPTVIGGTFTITQGTWTSLPAPTLTYTLYRGTTPDGTAAGYTITQARAYVAVIADIGPSLTWREIPNGMAGFAVASNAHAWIPTDDANTFAWGNPSATSTTFDGSNKVSALTDGAAVPHSYSQATGAAKPTYVASDAAYNNQPTVQLFGAQRLDSTAFAAQSQPFADFICGEAGAVGTQAFVDVVSGVEVSSYASAGVATEYAGTTPLSSGIAVTSKSVVCFVHNGGSSAVYVNDSVTAAATGGAGTAAPTSIRVGDSVSTGAPLTGKLREWIRRTGAPSAAVRQTFMAYLGYWAGKVTT